MTNQYIYHITSRTAWQQAQAEGAYRGDTLATEGFIHTSTGSQVARTANRFYYGRAGLLLLVIQAARLSAELRYEPASDGEMFPHIYGPLNLDAVTDVREFAPQRDGTFLFDTTEAG
jgi:uncharacterized protein (DUF952 family)